MPIGTSAGEYFEDSMDQALTWYGSDPNEHGIDDEGYRITENGKDKSSFKGGEYDNFNRSGNVEDRRHESNVDRHDETLPDGELESIEDVDKREYSDIAKDAGALDIMNSTLQVMDERMKKIDKKIGDYKPDEPPPFDTDEPPEGSDIIPEPGS